MHSVKTPSLAVQRELKRLQRDVRILRGGLVSLIGEDPEGEYRPSLVAEVLKAAAEQPGKKFTDTRKFRAALRRA